MEARKLHKSPATNLYVNSSIMHLKILRGVLLKERHLMECCKEFDPEFLLDQHLMYDTLYELSTLSELLQHRATTIIYAHKMIRRTIRGLENLFENGWTKSLEAECAWRNLKFNLTTLIQNAYIINTSKVNFLSILIKFMQARSFKATVADYSAITKNL